MSTTIKKFYEEILRLRKQKPFRPFFIDMSDGEQLEVKDTYAVGMAPENPVGVVLDSKLGIRRFRTDQIVAVRPAGRAL